MRLQRYGLIFLAFFSVFIVSGYEVNVPAVRWFHHALMTVLAGGWIGWRLFKRGRGLPPSPLNPVLLAVLVLGLVSILFSVNPRMAFEAWWSPLIYTIGFLFFVNAFQRAQERLIMEILFFVAMLVIFLSGIQVVSAFLGTGLIRAPGQGWIEFIGAGIPFPLQSDMRIFLPLGVSTQVAGFVAPLLIISMTWASTTTRGAYRIILWSMTILLALVLILTFSRGGLVAVVAGGFALVGLRLLQGKRWQTLMTRRNLALMGALLTLVVMVGALVFSLSTQSSRRAGDSLRFDLWRSAITMSVDHPLTGVGIGQYGRTLREYRSVAVADDRISTAHNVYLHTTAEQGIGALVLFVVAGWVIVQSWWRLRERETVNSVRWHRLNGMMSALFAFGIHNLFDTLNIFASMILVALIVAYCTVQPAQSRLDPVPRGHRRMAGLALIVIVLYGVWFALISDRAHWHFIRSLDDTHDQLAEARQAQAIDPALELYHLHVAYLLGEKAYQTGNADLRAEAIARHLEALEREPTWDDGMMTLSALYEQDQQWSEALYWLERAQTVYRNPSAHLHWARLAETYNLTDTEMIRTQYEASLSLSASRILPLSTFWVETPLREQALRDYLPNLTLDRQYRVVQVHFPAERASLVPEVAQNASEWWVVGEHALTQGDNPSEALDAFNRAIDARAGNGDYYVSRAQAQIALGHSAEAERDLQIAQFLGTRDSYPEVLLATLTDDPEEARQYQMSAVPGLLQEHGFEAVSFNGRIASFVVYRSMRFLGRGDAVMQVWYELAEQYRAEGDLIRAEAVYQAIAFSAPEDTRVFTLIDDLLQD
ncbi:MAG: O-antigen ligase family protein [Anaerolineae bacterium]